MSMTLSSFVTGLRERLGDDGGGDWTTSQMENAVRDAMRIAWPFFYEPVVDETSFAGANYQALDTTELAVPTAFYSVTGIGKITRLDWRRYAGAGTNFYRWQPLRRGLWIDDLQEAEPKIHFTATRSREFELLVRGIRPLTLPASNGSLVAGTDWPGFVVWLYFTSEKLLRAGRQRGAAYDSEVQTQRRVLASQEAQDMAKMYRMRPVGQTLFRRW